MLDKLKELWNKWNVQVKVVGGVLVIATVWGTCSYEPNLGQVMEEAVPESVEPTSNTNEAEVTVTGADNSTEQDNTVEGETQVNTNAEKTESQ